MKWNWKSQVKVAPAHPCTLTKELLLAKKDHVSSIVALLVFSCFTPSISEDQYSIVARSHKRRFYLFVLVSTFYSWCKIWVGFVNHHFRNFLYCMLPTTSAHLSPHILLVLGWMQERLHPKKYSVLYNTRSTCVTTMQYCVHDSLSLILWFFRF